MTEKHSTDVVQSFDRGDLVTAFARLQALVAKNRAREAHRARTKAIGFNVFDFIRPSENTLSDILRFLLDPSESHGQSDLFIRTILAAVRPGDSIFCQDATVVREALTYTVLRYRRRIDIVATLPNFCLGIETKKFSGEGVQQINDYCEHLRNISNGKYCLIFLNRTGSEAESIAPALAKELQKKRQLVIWSWEKSIPHWLQQCHAAFVPAKIKHFLDDFRAAASTTLPLPPIDEQEKTAAVLWKIQNAVEIEDAIVRNARDLKKSVLRRLFTQGLRGEPLKETEIGLMPKGWDGEYYWFWIGTHEEYNRFRF
jgi:hypothetical protein